MILIDQYLHEGLDVKKPFIIHQHDARSTSPHYDLRILHPTDNKILLSFAFGKDFLKLYNTKIIGVKTKDHDPRWLTLKSYRLDNFDKGSVIYNIFTSKFIELSFNGEKMKGNYKLFQVKAKRDDRWLLIKK